VCLKNGKAYFLSGVHWTFTVNTYVSVRHNHIFLFKHSYMFRSVKTIISYHYNIFKVRHNSVQLYASYGILYVLQQLYNVKLHKIITRRRL